MNCFLFLRPTLSLASNFLGNYFHQLQIGSEVDKTDQILSFSYSLAFRLLEFPEFSSFSLLLCVLGGDTYSRCHPGKGLKGYHTRDSPGMS
jgi:hypothetical protein